MANKWHKFNTYCRLQLVVETYGNLNDPTNYHWMKVPKVAKLTNKNMLLKTLESSVITSQMPTLSIKYSFGITKKRNKVYIQNLKGNHTK